MTGPFGVRHGEPMSEIGKRMPAADFDPGAFLLAGRFDPTALLGAYCVRRTFLPLVWIGLIGVAVASGSGRLDVGEIGSFGEALRALLSPAAGVIVAIAARLLAAAVGFVLAWRVARSIDVIRRPFGPGRVEAFQQLLDQVNVTRAARALRWTRAVREEASARLGPTGRRFELAERLLSFANVALFGALVVVVVVFAVV